MQSAAWLPGFWLLALACAQGAEWDDKAQKALDSVMEKARPSILEHFESHVSRLVKTTAEEHSLSPAQSARLESAAPAVVQQSAALWEKTLRQAIQRDFTQVRPEARDFILNYDIPQALANFSGRHTEQPDMLPQWAQAMRQALPPASYQSWEEDKQTRLAARQSQIEEIIQTTLEQTSPARKLETQLAPLLADLAFDNLPPAQRKGMETILAQWKKEFTAESVDITRFMLETSNRALESYSKALRKKATPLRTPNTASWLDQRLPALLEAAPAATRARFEAQLQARQERASQALRHMRVMIVELLVPMNQDDLEKVSTLAAGLPVSKDDPLLTDYQLEPWKPWQEKPASDKLAALLDDLQERLWSQGVKHLIDSTPRVRAPDTTAMPPARHPGLGPPDPSEVEAIISAHVAEDSLLKARQGLQPLLRRAEEAVRVAGLDDPARAALELAARGAIQEQIDAYRRNQARFLRSQLQDATVLNIRQRLAVLGGFSFNSGGGGNSLFDAQLDSLLNEEQNKKLKQHQQAILQRRHQAQLALLLARLDRDMRFSQEQHDALHRKLTAIMETYGADMEAVFADWGERKPWFLQSFYLALPAAGIEENDLKRILNDRQLQLWERLVTQQGGHYWDQVLEKHQQRQQAGAANVRRRVFINP